MAVLESVQPTTEVDDVVTPPARPSGSGAVRAAAIGLWAVVGSLLAYGVLQTAVKAAALLT